MPQAKRKRNFGFFIAELFILILGITASFALNEYRIGQQERKKEQKMLVNFRKT